MMKKLPTTKYLQLPLSFDVLKLLEDLKIASNHQWISHHYTHNYNGNWNSIALLAPGGHSEKIRVEQNTKEALEKTEVLTNCEYFEKVIDTFQCPILSARLLKLEVGSIIKPHKDFQLGYENNNFRIHIPITTNKDVTFILDDERIPMLPGQCWYTNVNFTHSVSNLGKTDRVHLVIDCERNSWSDELFFSLAPKESFALQDQLTRETIQKIISELERDKSPAAKKLLDNYQKQLLE